MGDTRRLANLSLVIVQVRGIAGSGKSTVVRQLLIDHGGEEVERHTFTRTNGKKLHAPLWRCDGDLYVIGRYDLGSTSGSGGDFVNGPVGLEVIRYFGQQGLRHIVWESLRGSNETPRGERLALFREIGVEWATLDTPLTTCVERIYQRRDERASNVGADLNIDSLRKNHQLMHRYVTEAVGAGIYCHTLHHNRAYGDLHDLLRSRGGWECGREHTFTVTVDPPAPPPVDPDSPLDSSFDPFDS